MGMGVGTFSDLDIGEHRFHLVGDHIFNRRRYSGTATTMNPETQFSDAMVQIADTLSVTVEYVFTVFVQAQAVMGIMSILSVITVTILTCAGGYTTLKYCTKAIAANEGFSDDTGNMIKVVWTLFGTTMSLLISAWVCTILYIAVLKIVCPEYTAMQEIIELVIP